MKSICRAHPAAVAIIAFGLLSACAMAPKAEAPVSGGEVAPAPEAPAPAEAALASTQAQDGPEPATLADAEALLEKARADLNQIALNEPAAVSASAGAAAPRTFTPAPPKATEEAKRERSSAAADSPGKPEPQAAIACETACKAFASLTRASDAVCRLDADDGKHCERARQIRQDASRRVASCGCVK